MLLQGPLSPTAAALRSGSPGHKRARSVATLRLSTGSLGLFPSHNDMDAKLESNRRLGYLLDKALLALHEVRGETLVALHGVRRDARRCGSYWAVMRMVSGRCGSYWAVMRMVSGPSCTDRVGMIIDNP